MADSGTCQESFRHKYKKNAVFQSFANNTCLISIVKRAFESLQERSNALALLNITACDAGAGFGIEFPNACCRTLRQSTIWSLKSIFRPGMDMLERFLGKPTVFTPKHAYEEEMLTNLFGFLDNKESEKILSKLSLPDVHGETESDVAVILAEHFFSKLASSQSYTLDNSSPKTKSVCNCHSPACDKNVESNYSRTATGSGRGWYGNLDIIVGSDNLGVVVETVAEEDGTDGESDAESEETIHSRGRFTDDRCYNQSDSLEQMHCQSSAIAQTIVSSFVHKTLHPGCKHFLRPLFCVSGCEVIIYFYDCVQDVLLQTKSMRFVSGIKKRTFCMETVITVWLALHYQLLGSGTPDSLRNAPKSRFREHVGSQIDVYEEGLSMFEPVTPEMPPPFLPDSHYEFVSD